MQGSAELPALEALRGAEAVLRVVEPFDEQHIEAALEADVEQRSWKKRHAFMPIRVAISGQEKTPPLMPMLAALGRERVLLRLEDAIHLLTD
jgi:glutamyl-tRNA synthetase